MPRPRFTYANVVATLCLVLLAGYGTAHAAGVAANSVGSLQIRNGQVARVDLRPNAVDSSRVAPNSLTGADVRESSLRGIRAATVGGFGIRKFRTLVRSDAPARTILRVPGRFRLDARCYDPSPPRITVVSLVGGTQVYSTSIRSYGADDTGGGQNISSASSPAVAAGASVRVDAPAFANQVISVKIITPSGAVTDLSLVQDLRNNTSGGQDCFVAGTAIGD